MMIKTICLSCTSLMLFISASAQSDQKEYGAIATTLNYYLEGGTNNDFETLKKAFHKEASMQFIGNDGHQSVNAIDFFEKGMKPGPKQNRTTKIESIQIAGNAAKATLHIDYETFRFVDYMTLLKIEGEWKVVSKVFYRQTW
ncbi:MAG: nuclear transport factor 2 family protein [Bacteroidota bacterium]